jgi:t-SNARE complex subunit (syntaxin)
MKTSKQEEMKVEIRFATKDALYRIAEMTRDLTASHVRRKMKRREKMSWGIIIITLVIIAWIVCEVVR